MSSKNLKIEVLAVTMNAEGYNLPRKMNIKSDIVIGNQSNLNKVEEIIDEGRRVRYYTFAERGVGLNRNNILMRADCDICVFSDDDVYFINEYVDRINLAFSTTPKADVIVFNILENKTRRYVNKSVKRVWYHNFMRYGIVRVACKLKSIRMKGIYFNQCFGGGAQFSHGEDTLFLYECLRKKLKIYSSPLYIAELLDVRESSWFQGYTSKYIYDQGKLYWSMAPRFAWLLCLQDVIRKRDRYKHVGSLMQNYKLMVSACNSN